MNIIRNLFFGLAAVIVLASLVGLLALPRISKIERSLVMHAPADIIYDQVNDLKKNEAWTPWKDPDMKITYGPITVGKGAMSSWVSKAMGNGTMIISETVPTSSIDIDLDFGSMGKPKCHWAFVPEGDSVKVTETMTSDAGFNPARRWLSLISDKVVGPMFEVGLVSLKEVSEARAAALKTEQATLEDALQAKPR